MRQRFVEPAGILAAGDGDVALAAASALDRLGRVLDEVGRLDDRSPGATAATSDAPPVSDSPTSTTVAMPCWRTAIARSRRSPGARPSIRSTTTPLLAPAASSAARPVGQLGPQRLELVLQRLELVELALARLRRARRAWRRAAGRPRRSPARRAAAARRWPAPVTASMRRRLEPIDPSLTTLTVPMSPVARTWVPPHSSRLLRPASRTRTMSPYLSPKKAVAPIASASSFDVSYDRTGSLLKRLGVDQPLDLLDLGRRSPRRSARSRTGAGPGRRASRPA